MQLLVDRGLAAGGIGVSPGTVRGIPDLPLSTLKSCRPVLLNPFNRGNATPLSAEQFHYAFGNTLSREESDEIYKRYHVPAANRVLFQVANANINFRTPVRVDWKRTDRAPMLFIGAAEDHVVPAKVVKKMAAKYATPVEYKEFPNRPHFPGGPGWEEVVDYALTGRTRTSSRDPALRSAAAGGSQGTPSSRGGRRRARASCERDGRRRFGTPVRPEPRRASSPSRTSTPAAGCTATSRTCATARRRSSRR